MHKLIAGQFDVLYDIPLARVKIENNVLFHANSMAEKYLMFINVLCREYEFSDGTYFAGRQFYKTACNYKSQSKKWRPEGRQNVGVHDNTQANLIMMMARLSSFGF